MARYQASSGSSSRSDKLEYAQCTQISTSSAIFHRESKDKRGVLFQGDLTDKVSLYDWVPIVVRPSPDPQKTAPYRYVTTEVYTKDLFEEGLRGTVKNLKPSFGFIQGPNNEQVYFSAQNLEEAKYQRIVSLNTFLREGEEVIYSAVRSMGRGQMEWRAVSVERAATVQAEQEAQRKIGVTPPAMGAAREEASGSSSVSGFPESIARPVPNRMPAPRPIKMIQAGSSEPEIVGVVNPLGKEEDSDDDSSDEANNESNRQPVPVYLRLTKESVPKPRGNALSGLVPRQQQQQRRIMPSPPMVPVVPQAGHPGYPKNPVCATPMEPTRTLVDLSKPSGSVSSLGESGQQVPPPGFRDFPRSFVRENREGLTQPDSPPDTRNLDKQSVIATPTNTQCLLNDSHLNTTQSLLSDSILSEVSALSKLDQPDYREAALPTACAMRATPDSAFRPITKIQPMIGTTSPEMRSRAGEERTNSQLSGFARDEVLAGTGVKGQGAVTGVPRDHQPLTVQEWQKKKKERDLVVFDNVDAAGTKSVEVQTDKTMEQDALEMVLSDPEIFPIICQRHPEMVQKMVNTNGLRK